MGEGECGTPGEEFMGEGEANRKASRRVTMWWSKRGGGISPLPGE